MSELTHSSMRDARDAEDNRLLETGEIDLLLAGWYETIVARCVAKMRGPVGHDVAQAVCERLWRELKAGKHRDGRWPFRVIVHKVIGYVCAGWYEKGWGEGELIEIDGPPTTTFTGDVELRLDARGVRRDAAAGRRRGGAAVAARAARARPDRGAARQAAERRLPGPLPHQAASAGVARVVTTTVEQLLDEFVGRWTRGEPLAVDELLVRAGPQADELAGLIDAFLERAPRREPTPEALAFVRSLDEPPLLRARQALGLKLDDSLRRSSRGSASARGRARRCAATTSSSSSASSTRRAWRRACGTR